MLLSYMRPISILLSCHQFYFYAIIQKTIQKYETLLMRDNKPAVSQSVARRCCVQTIYIRKTIYFAYAKLHVLYKVYTFAYAKTYTCANHIVLHNAKLYVLHNL